MLLWWHANRTTNAKEYMALFQKFDDYYNLVKKDMLNKNNDSSNITIQTYKNKYYEGLNILLENSTKDIFDMMNEYNKIYIKDIHKGILKYFFEFEISFPIGIQNINECNRFMNYTFNQIIHNKNFFEGSHCIYKYFLNLCDDFQLWMLKTCMINKYNAMI